MENPVKTIVDNKRFYFINIGWRNLFVMDRQHEVHAKAKCKFKNMAESGARLSTDIKPKNMNSQKPEARSQKPETRSQIYFMCTYIILRSYMAHIYVGDDCGKLNTKSLKYERGRSPHISPLLYQRFLGLASTHCSIDGRHQILSWGQMFLTCPMLQHACKLCFCKHHFSNI